ncbi:hypothetical protein ACS0TY_003581 [Phlomoides rotata]
MDEEIKHTVFSIDGSNAPGPDGFGGCFYHACWDVIIEDIYAAVRFFFTHSLIPPGMNSNFVALIPKKSRANRMVDFRPIVMGYFLFKIFHQNHCHPAWQLCWTVPFAIPVWLYSG